MPVDVMVEIGMRAGEDVPDAYRVRTKLAEDLETMRLDGAIIARARDVGGGMSYEPLVGDVQYETVNLRDAMLTVAAASASLLRQGFGVAPRGGKLVVTARTGVGGDPPPGVAFVSVIAPLGTT